MCHEIALLAYFRLDGPMPEVFIEFLDKRAGFIGRLPVAGGLVQGRELGEGPYCATPAAAHQQVAVRLPAGD
jgi:hypothetical protein